MDTNDLLAYVKSSAALLALPLEEARAQRVAEHLQRTAGLAAQLQAFELPVEAEPAELYRPAPFAETPAGADVK